MYKENDRIAKTCPCCGSVDLRKSSAILMPFIAHRVFGWQPVEIDKSWGLKTIQNGHAYSVCNSCCCADCNFLFLDIRFSDNELGDLYKGYRDAHYVQLREFYEPGYGERNQGLLDGAGYIDQVEAFLTPHLSLPVRLLDWGGDTGKNSPFKIKNKCWHIYDIGNQMPIDGATAVDKEAILSNSYDLIVCSNVLEHVPFPADMIIDIKKYMNNETLLYIEVPYEKLVREWDGNTLIEKEKKHWHEHINFFTKNALKKLINSCDLDLVSINVMEVPTPHLHEISTLFQLACKIRP
jgi:hypothetical protein